jgi:hypothetical protein
MLRLLPALRPGLFGALRWKRQNSKESTTAGWVPVKHPSVQSWLLARGGALGLRSGKVCGGKIRAYLSGPVLQVGPFLSTLLLVLQAAVTLLAPDHAGYLVSMPGVSLSCVVVRSQRNGIYCRPGMEWMSQAFLQQWLAHLEWTSCCPQSLTGRQGRCAWWPSSSCWCACIRPRGACHQPLVSSRDTTLGSVIVSHCNQGHAAVFGLPLLWKGQWCLTCVCELERRFNEWNRGDCRFCVRHWLLSLAAAAVAGHGTGPQCLTWADERCVTRED